MAKLIERDGVLMWNCPGCGCVHEVTTRTINAHGDIWQWNGDRQHPTISPSVLVRQSFSVPTRPVRLCHFFIVDGVIRFLNDCTHELAGHVVPMSDCDDF